MKIRYNLYLMCLILVIVILSAGCIQSNQPNQPVQSDSNALPTVSPISEKAQPLTTAISKTIVIKNIKGRDTPSNLNIEIRFGSDYINFISTTSPEGVFSVAKITEHRTVNSLIVNVTDFEKALKQTNYPYWQTWRFEDDGIVVMNDYDGDYMAGEWSIKSN